MVKVSGPLAKVRGQLLSEGFFGCVAPAFGLGESGSDCCCALALKGRWTTSAKLQRIDNRARVINLNTCISRPAIACKYQATRLGHVSALKVCGVLIVSNSRGSGRHPDVVRHGKIGIFGLGRNFYPLKPLLLFGDGLKNEKILVVEDPL